jgi:hypothetical protein
LARHTSGSPIVTNLRFVAGIEDLDVDGSRMEVAAVQVNAGRVVVFSRHLARAVGLWLPIKKLGIDAVLLNQVIDTIPPSAAAFVALDAQHVELAD